MFIRVPKRSVVTSQMPIFRLNYSAAPAAARLPAPAPPPAAELPGSAEPPAAAELPGPAKPPAGLADGSEAPG